MTYPTSSINSTLDKWGCHVSPISSQTDAMNAYSNIMSMFSYLEHMPCTFFIDIVTGSIPSAGVLYNPIVIPSLGGTTLQTFANNVTSITNYITYYNGKTWVKQTANTPSTRAPYAKASLLSCEGTPSSTHFNLRHVFSSTRLAQPQTCLIPGDYKPTGQSIYLPDFPITSGSPLPIHAIRKMVDKCNHMLNTPYFQFLYTNHPSNGRALEDSIRSLNWVSFIDKKALKIGVYRSANDTLDYHFYIHTRDGGRRVGTVTFEDIDSNGQILLGTIQSPTEDQCYFTAAGMMWGVELIPESNSKNIMSMSGWLQ